jgi:hypothetical protein
MLGAGFLREAFAPLALEGAAFLVAAAALVALDLEPLARDFDREPELAEPEVV